MIKLLAIKIYSKTRLLQILDDLKKNYNIHKTYNNDWVGFKGIREGGIFVYINIESNIKLYGWDYIYKDYDKEYVPSTISNGLKHKTLIIIDNDLPISAIIESNKFNLI